MAITLSSAPESNGCFEVSAAQAGTVPWPPPSVSEKDYTPTVGELLWSKFNGDGRLVELEQMESVASEVTLMLK